MDNDTKVDYVLAADNRFVAATAFAPNDAPEVPYLGGTTVITPPAATPTSIAKRHDPAPGLSLAESEPESEAEEGYDLVHDSRCLSATK